MNTKNIRIDDYDYPLADERIAKYPLPKRDESKLLYYRHGEVGEYLFRDLPDLLREGSLLVFNNTRVIQARLHFRKATGALIEVFLLEPASPKEYEQMFVSKGHCAWFCIVGNLKKWKGETLRMNVALDNGQCTLTAKRREQYHTSYCVDFAWDNPDVTFAEILDAVGELPIPPYLKRDTQESDKTTYQTVYSKIKGSVAAPTAGLHFTNEVLERLREKGFYMEELTLHVGAGTFKPVKSETINDHEMHSEHFAVKKTTILSLLKNVGNVVAVGTTSVRTLESLYYLGTMLLRDNGVGDISWHVSQWIPYETEDSVTVQVALNALVDYMTRHKMDVLHASTQIIIAPGYKYKVVNNLITNFHQPKSTLLLLVSAFVNGDWHRIYDYALSHDFRFLSYGDSSLLIP
ncbi:MAG: S-adenosylmethionine:tRNA ribosyltransferase-isomerase [Prevotella sp.]|nr:S-adenosylmethionine:tRNA ribosyltransferase-isomerase [Prevotella sp.]